MRATLLELYLLTFNVDVPASYKKCIRHALGSQMLCDILNGPRVWGVYATARRMFVSNSPLTIMTFLYILVLNLIFYFHSIGDR